MSSDRERALAGPQKIFYSVAGRVMDRIRPRYWTCRECACTNSLWEWGCYRCGDGGPTSWFLGFPRWDD